MKIYTRRGDDGATGLLYGGRVRKDHPLPAAYGDADEAVAAIGLARSLGPRSDGLEGLLLDLQRQLFVLGAELATLPENASRLEPGVSKVTEEMVADLEKSIDRLTEAAPLPQYFVVPGSSPVSAALDLARCVVRRCERNMVAMAAQDLLADRVVLSYVNRLSDLLFVAARYEEHALGVEAPPSREP